MHANLRISIAAATLIATVPAAGIASANQGKGKERGDKSSKRCERGKGYEAKGLLAEGSFLEQVEGFDTARRGDDRFSGIVVIHVKQGNKRGRQDRGLTSYEVTDVRALGTMADDDPLPPTGTRVQVVGKVVKGCAPKPTPTPSPEPTPEPDPSASLLRRESAPPLPVVDDASGADYPGAEEPEGEAPKVSTAMIRLVVFKPGRQRPEQVRGEDEPGDDDRPRVERPRGDDAEDCAPDGERQSYGEEEEDLDDRVCELPEPRDRDDDPAGDDDGPRGPRR